MAPRQMADAMRSKKRRDTLPPGFGSCARTPRPLRSWSQRTSTGLPTNVMLATASCPLILRTLHGDLTTGGTHLECANMNTILGCSGIPHVNGC